jgi:2-polyprenyl-6-methoxyphenol hydroxylase-like FAD-dependent oxidoreductase
MSDESISTQCCIVGGGPAGMMLGFLLARAGIDVTVLEKHADFLRDFRGDTIHPSTLELMAELGFLDEFLKRPHQEIARAGGELGDVRLWVADFTHVPTRCKFIAFMPQWDFLNFLAEKARALPTFRLLMETEAVDLVTTTAGVAGVKARSKNGELAVTADLVIGADGRHSVLREKAGLEVEDLGAPMDVLWLKLDRKENEEHAVLGRLSKGQALIMLDRGTYWQCAFVIRKGAFEEIRRQGLDALRARVAELARRESANEIASWDDVHLLTVRVDRLRRWHKPGLLFIGDAAHAMSPVGGVGINLAVQDAVAAANILAGPLRDGRVTSADLARVERRRRFPTRATQTLQVAIQNRVIGPVLAGAAAPKIPTVLKLLQRFPALQRIPARLIGIGIRPEHVRTPAAPPVR